MESLGTNAPIPSGGWRRILLAAGLIVVSATTQARGQLGLAGAEFLQHFVLGGRGGESLAVGDFDGDGRDDLAIGFPNLPYQDINGNGMVLLRRHTEQIGVDGSVGVAVSNSYFRECESSDDRKTNLGFGAAIAFGHFNDDAYEDLAIGMPGAAVGAVNSGGGVCILYGEPGFPEFDERVRFDQGNLVGAPENGDEVGAALATGDLDGDGYDDLVVGAPGESVFYEGVDHSDAGAIHLIRSSALGTGLSTAGNLIRHQGQEEVSWEPEANERFGSALVIDHFILGPAPQVADLMVGAPGDFGTGTVTVFAGSISDPLGTSYSPLFPDSLAWDLLGTSEAGDDFGYALATGDFDGDGSPDLAIGIPGDSALGAATEAGAVMVMYGTGVSGNISDAGEQLLFEQTIDGGSLAGVVAFDRFGTALGAGDFNHDGIDDLIVGAPLDNSLGVANSGEVTVVYGSPAGLDVAGAQIVAMIFLGTQDATDEFGFAVAAGDFHPGFGDDLIVGVPGRLGESGMDSELDSGGWGRFHNSFSIFADDFELGVAGRWDVISP